MEVLGEPAIGAKEEATLMWSCRVSRLCAQERLFALAGRAEGAAVLVGHAGGVVAHKRLLRWKGVQEGLLRKKGCWASLVKHWAARNEVPLVKQDLDFSALVKDW
ncbi:unnamed protein product [Ilex paraguariensis]|uniref:Uncharacterized protein n=1 Tax=Ilex paraguariensis TaxID=185542 RepID=A0ABC8SCZ1_9AQUA